MSEVKQFKSGDQVLDYVFIDNGASESTVLLHGYGANMRDLAGLATISPSFKNYNWYFPDGVLKVPIGPFMMGKAWFPIDMELMNRAMMSGGFEHLFADKTPDGLVEACELLMTFIKEVVTSGGKKFTLGGFSQGSMVSNYLVFEKGLSPEKLILLSSTLVAKTNLEDRLNRSEWTGPIFQSHGVEDPVLPISKARELKTIFNNYHRNVDYQEFSGGHEIPPAILQALIQFLSK